MNNVCSYFVVLLKIQQIVKHMSINKLFVESLVVIYYTKVIFKYLLTLH